MSRENRIGQFCQRASFVEDFDISPTNSRIESLYSDRGKREDYSIDFTGICVCPKCLKKMPCQQDIPCHYKHCPNCGSFLIHVIKIIKVD